MVAVRLAAAFAFARFAGVAAEVARRFANGGGPLFIAAARRPVFVAARWSVFVAARRPIFVSASRRPLGPCARVVICATAMLTADFTVARLLRVAGGRFRRRPRCGSGSRAWGGPRFGRAAHAEFGGEIIPGARLRRRRLGPLRRLRTLRRRLLRPGRSGAGRVVGGRRAERFGERGPRVVGIVIRHDADSLRGGRQGGDGRQPSGDALTSGRIHESPALRQVPQANRPDRAMFLDGPAGRSPARQIRASAA